jgi:FixJ family two-component response regulator
MALVIIVDDDSHVRASLENLLASVGYTTASFASGEALLDDGAWGHADCLLLDIRMKGMSGLELQMQLLMRNCKTPVIFLTAHYDDETRTRALSAGAFGFIAKPFDEDVLLSTIDGAVAKSQGS